MQTRNGCNGPCPTKTVRPYTQYTLEDVFMAPLLCKYIFYNILRQ